MQTYLDIFDKTVLICCDHFSDSSIISPRNRASDYLSIGIFDITNVRESSTLFLLYSPYSYSKNNVLCFLRFNAVNPFKQISGKIYSCVYK